MKKVTVVTAASVLTFTLSSPFMVQAAPNDIKGHYFEKDMQTLINKGLLTGYEDGTYRPNREVTRAEFTIFLVRALNIPKTKRSISFKDVKKGSWYYADIATASQNKLIGGYPDGSFKPNQHISRQEMAAITQRALSQQGIEGKKGKLNFKDLSSIDPIYHSAIASLLNLKIMVGKTDKNGNSYFQPNAKTTRGETSAIVNRVLTAIQNKPKPKPNPSPNPPTPAPAPAKPPVTGVKETVNYSHYNYSFSSMIDKQMAISPITDRPKVDGDGTYLASRSLVEYYANPNNFSKGTNSYFQFVALSKPAGLHASELNEKVLKGKGIFEGQGQAFIDAAQKFHINEVYLIAHALHETGNGTSALSTGYLVSEVDGKKVQARKTYNMYGVGAYDKAPNKAGSEYAYKQGWFTPRDAIIGGAEFIAERFINKGQDTLYKMRWNPASPATRQYATHVMWADLQTTRMANIYHLLDSYTLHFDVPTFNNLPKASAKPTGEAQYDVIRTLEGKLAVTTANVNFRTGPTTNFPAITTLYQGTEVKIIGENGGWYKVNANGVTGWVSGDYVVLKKDMKVMARSLMLLTEEEELQPLPEVPEEPEVTEESVATEQLLVKDELEKSSEKENHTEEQDPAESDIIMERLIGEVTGDTVYLRTEASNADDTIITTVDNGTEVEIIDETDEWYLVRVAEDEGWILKEDIIIQ
ncbi:S-layer homology domain-containing protein [Oceanobacillus sp. Castelsardo]|uniref:S-layer homology domain-containing protein n=1 Tax=Oceanobacillus sp. Castelsardo TaxID=1851204 RepID=UPI0008390EB6|nr:S-layer homology domain-containing protein [Oceanobacillus sp. Castelsardo]